MQVFSRDGFYRLFFLFLFMNMKTIHIFDMDDTLFEAPKFTEFVDAEHNEVIDDEKVFPEYFKKIKSAFMNEMSKEVYFKRMNDFVIPVNKNYPNGFPGSFIDYFQDKKYKRFFEVHNGIITVKSFPGFHSIPETLGKITNLEVIKDYQKVSNKMIITGRGEKLRDYIIKIFEELEIELPNYGLVLYDNGPLSIKDWKTEMIIKTIADNQWEEVHFYEDRSDWLYHAEGAVKERFPDVKFVPHLITNIKEKMKM